MLLNFEVCPRCSQRHDFIVRQLKPMVLSGDNKEMQCDTCNHSFKLPDCERIVEIARRQREKKYG